MLAGAAEAGGGFAATSTPTARASRASSMSGTERRSTASSGRMRRFFKHVYDVTPQGNWEESQHPATATARPLLG